MLATSYWSDWRRFRSHSGMTDRGRRGLRAEIVMDAHRLEKGVTLPRPRAWFGHEVIERLLGNIAILEEGTLTDEVDSYVISAALGALTSYFDANERTEPTIPDWAIDARDRAGKLAADHPARREADLGGVEPIGPTAMDASGIDAESFGRFVRSRHSVRNFASGVPDRTVIEEAIAIAATSPSVCNRQGSRVRVFERGPQADAVLAHQNGNQGFGKTASHVLVISQDIESFVSPGERNQAFVDGGIFAMSLMYALHAAGLGTCALNWSRTATDDRRLRAELSLPPNEVVVTLLVTGYSAAEALVTCSPSRPEVIS